MRTNKNVLLCIFNIIDKEKTWSRTTKIEKKIFKYLNTFYAV